MAGQSTGKPASRKRTAGKKTAKPPAKARKAAGGAAPDAMSAPERIDRRIEELGDWRGERLAEIRALIHEADPDVVEEWKWMGTPVWSHDGMYVLANPHKGKVKITFHHGAQLRDPKGLFNAGLDGNKWRAIDLREGDRLDAAAFKALLREAVAYNATHAVPKSKGSRRELPDGTAPAAGKPRLLSGGNPQIPKGDGEGPVQAYLAAMPEWKQEVGRRLDRLIVEAVPDVKKAVRWNSPFYGVEGRGWFLSFHCFTKYVKVTFFNGASLTPPPPGRSKQEEVRFLDLREDDALDEAQLTDWIRQASRLPGWVP